MVPGGCRGSPGGTVADGKGDVIRLRLSVFSCGKDRPTRIRSVLSGFRSASPPHSVSIVRVIMKIPVGSSHTHTKEESYFSLLSQQFVFLQNLLVCLGEIYKSVAKLCHKQLFSY